MFEGVNASEGIGIGTVVVAVEPDLTFEPVTIPEDQRTAERERYQFALGAFCKKTEAQAEHMKETVGENEAEIMVGHIAMAKDPGLTDQINSLIDNGVCAEQALVEASTMFENMFLAMDDEMFRLRASDIADIRTGLLCELLGKEVVDLSTLPPASVIVVHDLTPSMTATIDKDNVAGIVTEVGGRTSHSAIIARALEIPAVLSVVNSCAAMRPGARAIVDGTHGQVILDPDEATLADYTAKAETMAAEKAALEAFRGKETATADGVHKVLAVNIGGPGDVPAALEHDGEAIGLFRTEFLFMDATSLPTEEEQFQAYQNVALALKGAPVIIRTLDVGGDKEIPYLKLQKEDNPFMGYRAVRYCLDNPDEYKVQLRALLRASAFGDIKIMVPLVTCMEELRQVKALVEECKAELDAEGVDYNKDIEVGVMMETAAAANIADLLADEAAFFSIGTNDLTGYTMASDRGNDKVAYLYSWYYPAVLRAIKKIIVSGVEKGIMVGMCGEAAADPLLTPLLISWGMEEFSVSAPSVLRTRKTISQWTKADADALEEKVMQLKTAEEVKAALEEAARK